MKRIAALAALVLAVSLGLSGCGGDHTDPPQSPGGTGTIADPGPSSPATPVVKLVWDGFYCQRFHVENGTVPDIPGVYCARKYQGDSLLWNFYQQTALDQFDASAPLFRQSYHEADSPAVYDVRYWYSSQRWVRTPVGLSSPVELCWYYDGRTCTWVTVQQFRQNLQALQDQQARQRAQTQANQAQQSNSVSYQQAQAMMQEHQLRMMEIALRPECDYSYNGCAP